MLFLSWVELLLSSMKYIIMKRQQFVIFAFMYNGGNYHWSKKGNFRKIVDILALLCILLETIYYIFIRDLQFVDWLLMPGGLKSSMLYLILFDINKFLHYIFILWWHDTINYNLFFVRFLPHQDHITELGHCIWVI